MKLKFINLLLASVLLVGSAQVFTSCKDNEADLVQNLTKETLTLAELAQKDHEDLTALKAIVDKAVADINNLQTDVATVKSDVATLKSAQAAIDAALANYGDMAGFVAAFETLKAQIGTLDLSKYDELLAWYEANKDEIATTITKANQAYAMAEKNKTDIETLGQAVTDSVKALRDEAAANLKAVNDEIAKVWADNKTIKDAQTEMANTLNDLQPKVEANLQDIKDLKETVDKLIGRFNNLVTSVVLQGADSPIFGFLTTPIGITSNVLFNFAGYNNHDKQFPNDDADWDGAYVFTYEDLNFLQTECGVKTVNIPGGNLINEYNGNVGKLYFTVNPSNVNLEGKTFNLVNSRGEVFPVELRNVQPCDDLLEIGYSRGVTTGFYSADATVTRENVGGASFKLEDGLKAAAKEVIDQKSKSSLVDLAKAMYNQVGHILPALAIQTTWDDNGETNAVTTQYGIGAAVVKPLSFKTLDGKSFRQIHLPDLGDKEFSFDGSQYHVSINTDFSISYPEIKIRTAEIALDPFSTTVTINVDVDVLDEDGVKIGTAVGTASAPVNFTEEDLAQVNKNLKEQVNAAMQSVGKDIQESVDNMIDDITSQVESTLKSLEVQVNDQIDQVIADINNGINKKYQEVIDRIESSRLYEVAQRGVNLLNKVLADPNHFLQPILIYKSGSKVGVTSEVANYPTVFSGSGNAVTLVATTHTAETVCPCYKKFVAVTNVYKANDPSVSAQAGDAKCKQLAQNANKQPRMATVNSGTTFKYPLYIAGGQGYVYEITVQAMDFHGEISTNRCYVRVK